MIDKIQDFILYQGKKTELPPDGLIRTSTALYLNLKYFQSIFHLDGVFYFRRLVVTMFSEVELPIVREARQDQMRKNVGRLKGDVKADTTVGRAYPFFHLGMADWAVQASQQSQSADQTTLNLGLGAALAGGEANASLNYYSQQPFDEKLQYYQWRYVNNDNPVLRQVVAGKIFAQSTSSLYAPVVGIQFTNAPTIYRRSYGTYTLTNTTQPNWLVELYVNDVLVDYKKADASGLYTFEVPLIYGYTIVKLRFYGPYGEERTSMQYINIPFNFLPLHEFEYYASGGIVEDGNNSRFSRLSVNYGLSRFMTIGCGVEYLSSVTSGATMPFFTTSLRLAPRLLLSGEYTYSVRSRGLLSYKLRSGLQIDLDYTKYAKGQTAIYYNYLEERKATISAPIHTGGLALFSRLTLDQIVIPSTKYTNAEWALSGAVRGVGVNLSTYASLVQQDIPYIYSILSLTFQLPKKIIFTPQVQYDYKTNTPAYVKLSFDKRLVGNGYLDIAYQEYFVANKYSILVGMRYDFSFARVAFSVLQGNDKTYSRVEAASGSLIYDHKSNYLNANNRTNVGKGGIVVEPFLDLNYNGIRDKGEPAAPGLKLRINGGRIIYNDKDTLIRILDLEPYHTYLMELSRSSFDNISWQIKNSTYKVTINPNNFTLIEVPVVVVGEVTGEVSNKDIDNDAGGKGQGQIIVNIFDSSMHVFARTLTESDGFFSYIGLPPGNYTASIDSVQLHKLHLIAAPVFIPIHMSQNREGDVADGLEFKLSSTIRDTTTRTNKVISVNPKAGETEKIIPKKVIAEKGSYIILADIFDNIEEANNLKSRLVAKLKLPVAVVQKGDAWKVEIFGFAKEDDALIYLSRLEKAGVSGALIIKLAKPLEE